MLCGDIVKIIEKAYPKETACSWDNVGLLAGSGEKEVKKIYVALDSTPEVILDAAKNGADMLLTHHPLIFGGLKKVTDDDFISDRIIRLIKNDISYYALHTNYDMLRMGDIAADRIGLKDREVLDPVIPGANNSAAHDRLPDKSSGKIYGIGAAGYLPERMTLRDCCSLIKEKFSLENVRLFGNPERPVSRAAISPGSGRGMTGAAIEKGAEVLITGDIGHHEGIDANAKGLAVIDAGHYGLEHIFVDDTEDFIKKNCKDTEVIKAKAAPPFSVL